MANLFETAKKKQPRSKKEEHIEVQLPSLHSSMEKIASINEKIAELEAERMDLDMEIRDSAKEAMIKLYNKSKKFPGTLKVVAKDMSMQFITSDRYKKVDEERAEELIELYGEEIVEDDTKYSFNTAVLVKHMDHISELLMNSDKLSDEDKENLLESETTYAVKKGAIKELFSFKGVKTKVNNIIEDIQPIFSIKAIKKNGNN